MPAKRNFGRCTSLLWSAESLVTREIEERIHKPAANKTNSVTTGTVILTARKNKPCESQQIT